MAINCKCPKCGSDHVQLSNEANKHGILFTIIFGLPYLIIVFFKYIIGLMILVCYDWWMAIIKNKQNKGYVWKSKRWFSGKKRMYYCHECHTNFRG